MSSTAEPVRLDLNQPVALPTSAIVTDLVQDNSRLLSDGRTVRISNDSRAIELRTSEGAVRSIPILSEISHFSQVSRAFAWLNLKSDDASDRMSVLADLGSGQRWVFNVEGNYPTYNLVGGAAVVGTPDKISFFSSELNRRFDFPTKRDSGSLNVSTLESGHLIYGGGLPGVIFAPKGQPPIHLKSPDGAVMVGCDLESETRVYGTCQTRENVYYVVLLDQRKMIKSPVYVQWLSGSFAIGPAKVGDGSTFLSQKIALVDLNAPDRPPVEIAGPGGKPLIAVGDSAANLFLIGQDLSLYVTDEAKVAASIKQGRLREAFRGARLLGRANDLGSLNELADKVAKATVFSSVDTRGGTILRLPGTRRFMVPGFDSSELNFKNMDQDLAFVAITGGGSRLVDFKSGRVYALSQEISEAELSVDHRYVLLKGQSRDQLISVQTLREKPTPTPIVKSATMPSAWIEKCQGDPQTGRSPRLARLLRWRSGVGEGSLRALTETLDDGFEPIEIAALGEALQRFALLDQGRLIPLANHPNLIQKLEMFAANARPNPCFGEYEKQVAEAWLANSARSEQALSAEERLAWLVLAPYARQSANRDQLAAALTTRLRKSARPFQALAPLPERQLEAFIQALAAPLLGQTKPALSVVTPLTGGGISLVSTYPTEGFNSTLNAIGLYQGTIDLGWFPRREGQRGQKDLSWRSAGYEFQTRITAVRQADADRVYPRATSGPKAWATAKEFNTLVVAAGNSYGVPSSDQISTQLKADGWQVRSETVPNIAQWFEQRVNETDVLLDFSTLERGGDGTLAYPIEHEIVIGERVGANQRRERITYLRPTAPTGKPLTNGTLPMETLRSALAARPGRPMGVALFGNASRAREARQLMAAVWSPSFFVIPAGQGTAGLSFEPKAAPRALIEGLSLATPYAKIRESVAGFVWPDDPTYRTLVVDQLGVRAKTEIVSHHRRIEAAK